MLVPATIYSRRWCHVFLFKANKNEFQIQHCWLCWGAAPTSWEQKGSRLCCSSCNGGIKLRSIHLNLRWLDVKSPSVLIWMIWIVGIHCCGRSHWVQWRKHTLLCGDPPSRYNDSIKNNGDNNNDPPPRCINVDPTDLSVTRKVLRSSLYCGWRTEADWRRWWCWQFGFRWGEISED